MVNMTYDPKEIGMRLKELRTGKINIGHDYIMKLCVKFNVSADYFYFGMERELGSKDTENDDFFACISKMNEEEAGRALGMLKLAFPQYAA